MLRPLFATCLFGAQLLSAPPAAPVQFTDIVKAAHIGFVHFNERDVVRHNLVQQIIRAYEEFEAGHAARGFGASGASKGKTKGNGKSDAPGDAQNDALSDERNRAKE